MSQQSPVENAIKKSREFFRQQKFVEAEELLLKLLESDPNDEDALELLGMTHFFNKKLEAAKETFEHLTQVHPGHIKAWVNLGAVLNRMGDFKKAIEVLRRAVQKDRKCAEGYYNMGIAQRGLNLNTMAISAYKEAIKLKPDLVEAHLNLGNIYRDMKNMGLAIQCFQAGLKYDPGSKKAKVSLENALATQKAARKEASPFGRLVDVKELEKQQTAATRRVLGGTERKEERELVQNVTKTVRQHAKDLVPVLSESLHGNLMQLQKIVLQTDGRFSSAEHIDSFVLLLDDLQHHHTGIMEGLAEVRNHLAAK